MTDIYHLSTGATQAAALHTPVHSRTDSTAARHIQAPPAAGTFRVTLERAALRTPATSPEQVPALASMLVLALALPPEQPALPYAQMQFQATQEESEGSSQSSEASQMFRRRLGGRRRTAL